MKIEQNTRLHMYFPRFKVVEPRKIRPRAKIHNFAFKNSNVSIEEIIQKRKNYFM